MRSLLLLVVAIVLFLLAAIFDFGWFGADSSDPHTLGLVALGLGAFAGAHIP